MEEDEARIAAEEVLKQVMDEIARNVAEDRDDQSEELSEGVFEVERVLDVAGFDGVLKYQVRWKGYGPDDDSWEPAYNLQSANLAVKEYNDAHKKKVKKAQTMVIKLNKRKRGRRQSSLQNEGMKKFRQYGVAQEISSAKRSKTRDNMDVEDSNHVGEAQKRRNDTCSTRRVFRKRKAEDVRKAKNTVMVSRESSEEKVLASFISKVDTDEDSVGLVSGKKVGKNEKRTYEAHQNFQLEEIRSVKTHKSPVPTFGESDDNDIELKYVSKKKEQQKSTFDLGFPKPKVEFVGIVQCSDGAIKVIYNEKHKPGPFIVSVREAYEIDGMGLVQYLLNRGEFGVLQNIRD